MYVRFVVLRRDEDSLVELGLFQAAFELREAAKLDTAQESRLEEVMSWFRQHLKRPIRLSRSRHLRPHNNAISWFRDTAEEHIARMREIEAILLEHGVHTKMITTDRPGYLVYEDDDQATAVPFREGIPLGCPRTALGLGTPRGFPVSKDQGPGVRWRGREIGPMLLVGLIPFALTSCTDPPLPEPHQPREFLPLGSQNGRPVDHLEPEDGYFAEYGGPDPYDLRVAELLLGEHGYRRCQMVFKPSFEAERAVYIVREDEKRDAVVVARELAPPLWNSMSVILQLESTDGTVSYSRESRRNALDKVTVEVVESSAVLDAATAELLEEVWALALMQTRHPTHAVHGFDGTLYHAASWVRGFGYHTGKIWTPPPGSKPWDLVELAEALEEFALSGESERSAARRRLIRLAELLRKRLLTE